MQEKTRYTAETDLPLCLKVSDVAAAMGIGSVTAYQLVKSEGFPSITVGKRIVIPKAAFLDWLHNQTQEAI